MSTEKILVTGANGQLGSVLIPALCAQYGHGNVVATDIRPAANGMENRFELLDAGDARAVAQTVRRHRISQVYHLAAILSARGEEDPLATWQINTTAFFSVLEAARTEGIKKVFFPSSIAVFGKNINRYRVSQYENLLPATAYGMSKVASENWSYYYYMKYGLDVRSLRFPGVVGYQSLPGGGTTDYAVDIFRKAVSGEKFTCFLREDTVLPMVYMDDAIMATLQLMEAPADRLTVRTSYNLAGMSFSPSEITREIKNYYPEFVFECKPDFRQEIAGTWPERIDDTEARRDWGWAPRFDLEAMTTDMIRHLERNYHTAAIAG